jgi:NADPH:quinone reductase-like Zn-dependent oxidoreductase
VDFLHSLGASYVLDSSQPGFVSQLRSLAHQLKATLFLDAVAGDQTQQFLEAAPDGSTILLYAKLAGDPRFSNSSALPNKRIEGFYLPNWISKRNPLPTLLDLRTVQRMAVAELHTTVQRRFPLSEVQMALDLYQENMSAGKVLLVADPQAIPME